MFSHFQFKDINECAQGSHDCLPSLAFCLNNVGSYSCACNSEYVGDGKTTCGLMTPGKSQSTLSKADTIETGTMFLPWKRCPACRESTKRINERQGLPLVVCFREMSIWQRELTEINLPDYFSGIGRVVLELTNPLILGYLKIRIRTLP